MSNNGAESKNDLRASLTRLLKKATHEAAKSDIRTTIPGYFLAFDEEKQLAEVQIGVERLTVFGEALTPPPIVKCPVCIYGASGGVIEVEIKRGDECLIHFSQRAIDGWRSQGGVAPLTSVELYPERDAFVGLAPRSAGNAISGYTNNGIRMRSLDGAKHVHIKNNDDIETKNANGVATLKANGDFDANGAKMTSDGKVVTAAGVDLDDFKAEYDAHMHPGTGTLIAPTGGGPVSGNTGTPN